MKQAVTVTGAYGELEWYNAREGYRPPALVTPGEVELGEFDRLTVGRVLILGPALVRIVRNDQGIDE